MEKITLSVKEAADILDVSLPSMYKIVRRTDFPRVDVGRRILIPKALLERWLEARAEDGGDVLAETSGQVTL